MSLSKRFSTRAFVPSIVALLIAGCQPTVYLMPTPEPLRTGELDPFVHTPEGERSNLVPVAFATNRLPLGPRQARGYTPLFDHNLRLGIAVLRIGSDHHTWQDLYKVSTTEAREQDVALSLAGVAELAFVGTEEGQGELAPAARGFFDRLNGFLAESLDKNLTLYVHGANNNFYRATAQAAQYRHFTGRHSAVMAFAWPSAENLLLYGTDVENARETVPVFARLLELLARHTDARYINILAYSAGAQVVSPALAALREAHGDEDPAALRERLRLGEVYFAAPDVDFRAFLEHLSVYLGMVRNVSLSVNPNDTVLALAAGHHGVSRAGRPDPSELSEEETRWVIAESRRPSFDVILVAPEAIPELGKGAHDFWYGNPWVSTDVLVQMLFHARPAERGLQRLEAEGDLELWGFPADYPQRAVEAVRRLRGDPSG